MTKIHPKTMEEFDFLWKKLGLHLGYKNNKDETIKQFITSHFTDNRVLEEALENQDNYRKDGTLMRDKFLQSLLEDNK